MELSTTTCITDLITILTLICYVWRRPLTDQITVLSSVFDCNNSARNLTPCWDAHQAKQTKHSHYPIQLFAGLYDSAWRNAKWYMLHAQCTKYKVVVPFHGGHAPNSNRWHHQWCLPPRHVPKSPIAHRSWCDQPVYDNGTSFWRVYMRNTLLASKKHRNWPLVV